MSARELTILIIGGYGSFGGRLAHLLADVESLTLLIAGRSRAKAADFCAEFRGRARVIPQAFDRNGDVEAQLRENAPHLIVDVSGPFQSYGEDRYSLVKAAIAAGIDYIDFADGSEFVKGIGRFDREAKARGIFVLSGVSTFPVLTAAVVKELAKDMTNIEAVTGGIAPCRTSWRLNYHDQCTTVAFSVSRSALTPPQIGQRHENAKLPHGFGTAVWQVRADDPSGTYRAVRLTAKEGIWDDQSGSRS